MLSVNLTVSGRTALVVGGGRVGSRRVELLTEAGASVVLVDPRTPASPLPAGVRHLAEPFAPHHLDGVRLAFACAPPQVNAAVVAAAGERGAWVCSASDPGAGDFVLPSVARRGGLTFAVSTGGASPALARRIAAGLLAEFDDAYAEWVRVLGEVRRAVLAEVADPDRRRELLTSFADPRWLDRIRTAGADVTLAEMAAEVRERPAAI